MAGRVAFVVVDLPLSFVFAVQTSLEVASSVVLSSHALVEQEHSQRKVCVYPFALRLKMWVCLVEERVGWVVGEERLSLLVLGALVVQSAVGAPLRLVHVGWKHPARLNALRMEVGLEMGVVGEVEVLERVKRLWLQALLECAL